MKPLTPAQRKALRWGSTQGGVHVGNRPADGETEPPAKRVQRPVAAFLVAAGYAAHEGDVLLTLKAGKAALAVPTIDPPVYMHARDGLTTERHRAIPGEAEVIDIDTLKGYWGEESARRKAATEDRRDQARRLSRGTKRAA